ncbi:peptide chain release factor N(5)-glutamine methyltransferase [Spiroplasma platyhelix]|uniref:peptide chain release factor N(5)-glutamine methyltransferase n=1 Tax=Spiroplasma platyhelix PALS-1 TaxID=1276218 RepID=A0A846TWN0_9MOLU|nr:peptide chain release factor N(5)-glutamine methyltransferase [Spiroplasma platyhelix]MBE4704219.1 50S ribosomal protein L3 glutamine methyltransferase [Spiroplasma platyhelix PALS-1]NKE38592.1 peptide chain release factor N(5)-glutamine methyltransferase [Spiroplasma platyhelix PALS-1]UJB28803.1 release factor glutamine methyltransferase [Spiroplasma platyhelix PALS-1]
MQIYQFLNLARTVNDNENVNKIILVNLLNKDLVWLYSNLNTIKYDQKFLKKYLALVKQYADGLPLGYIFGYVFFNGNKILVDKNVLIPRNETEILVDRALFYAEKLFASKILNVLDLCTGSGCIAISMALKKANWNFIASDISTKTLDTARLNQNLHQLVNVKLVTSDLFVNLAESKFDLIVCNPPYIEKSSDTYQISKLAHEPELALFADDGGLEFYQRIFASVLNYTKPDFLLALEIGFDQKQALEKMLAEKFSSYFYWFEKDYQNHWRFLFISSKGL